MKTTDQLEQFTKEVYEYDYTSALKYLAFIGNLELVKKYIRMGADATSFNSRALYLINNNII